MHGFGVGGLGGRRLCESADQKVELIDGDTGVDCAGCFGVGEDAVDGRAKRVGGGADTSWEVPALGDQGRHGDFTGARPDQRDDELVESLQRIEVHGERGSSAFELQEVPLECRFDQRVLRGEVPEDGGDADLRSSGHLLGGSVRALGAEHRFGGDQDPLTVDLGMATHGCFRSLRSLTWRSGDSGLTDTPNPADVVAAVATAVSRLMVGGLDAVELEEQLDALAALYAHQTDVRHPFAPFPDHPLRTRAELRAHFASGGPDPTVERFEAVDFVVHQTADAEVVVVEFAYAGVVAGRTFKVPLIFVVRVHDGEIVTSRDYVDHVGMARAFGRLPVLAAGLAGTQPASRDLARRMHAAFNEFDLDAVDDLFAPEFYSHPLDARGAGAVKQRWAAMRAATPELRTEIVDLLAEGDRVVIRSRIIGGSEELIEILRIADGRIAELWGARGYAKRTT